jgi:hypothetical protein
MRPSTKDVSDEAPNARADVAEGSRRPDTDALIAFLDNEWRDVHHSRIQEWSSLGVVAAAHAALTQVPKLIEDSTINLRPTTVVLIASAFAAAFAIVGALLTCRHRRLMEEKLGWIYDAQDRLGLIKETSPWGVFPADKKMPQKMKGVLSRPRFLSTSGFILLFYALFALIDLAIFWSALSGDALRHLLDDILRR